MDESGGNSDGSWVRSVDLPVLRRVDLDDYMVTVVWGGPPGSCPYESGEHGSGS